MGKQTMRTIPLNQLHASQENARITQASPAALEELKASIEAHSLLQNLMVRDLGAKQEKRYQVTGGRRRLTALRSLAEDGKIAETYPVPCHMVNGDASDLELSLAENEMRVAMNAADAFEAYRRLNERGQTTAEIARRFGVSERRVHQLLSLASCAPELIAGFRDKALDLPTLKAFTVTTDHERQRQVWARIKEAYHTPTPREIKQMLSEGKVPATSSAAKLIGAEAYERAGGSVERDLFADEDERGVYFTNPEILDRLVDERLQTEAQKLLPTWKWAQVELNVDYNRLHSMHRLEPLSEGGTKEQEAEMLALRNRLVELEQMEPEAYDAAGGEEQYSDTEARIDVLENAMEVQANYRNSDKQFAGCIVTLGNNGEIITHAGLIREEDVPKPVTPTPEAAEQTGDAPGGADEEGPRQLDAAGPVDTEGQSPVGPAAAPPAIVAPMVTNYDEKPESKEAIARKEAGIGVSVADDLRAVRTEVIKAHLAKDPKAALDLLVFDMASSVLSLRYHQHALNVTASQKDVYPYNQANHQEINSTLGKIPDWKKEVKPPEAFLKARSRKKKFEAIAAMDQDAKLQLLAGLVALTLNPQLSFEPTAVEDIESIVERLNIKFAKLVRPSTKLYWSRVTRDRILEIAGETLGDEWVKRHKNARKSELADLMGQAFAKGGKPPADVDKAARNRALAWTMPGFTAFDKSEKMASAAGGATNGSVAGAGAEGGENTGGEQDGDKPASNEPGTPETPAPEQNEDTGLPAFLN